MNAYTITFYDGPNGTGSPIASMFSGNLNQAVFGALNPAQSVYFDTAYENIRSVVMNVVSNHGSTTYTGLAELAFNGVAPVPSETIVSFTSSAPFVQKPALPTLSWEVVGPITSLEISNSEEGTTDVTSLTTDGLGSLEVSPLGDQTYTLTLNGTVQQSLQVVGLPTQEKLHIYLLMGQSNMQGASGTVSPTDPTHLPVPRVIKFGSRVGMEQQFVTGGHPLTSLNWSAGSSIGMGLEFGKTLLAAETDPEVLICLINHALGTTAIQYWQPDAIAQDGSTLYNNAVKRAMDASQYGVVKGVLWHQGEYNANANQTNPSPEPQLYASRLHALVDKLRSDFENPDLPFIGGKLSPNFAFTGEIETIEGALTDLPNQRANTFCVDNNGLSGKTTDLIHFDAPSQLLLGQRYAAAMMDLLSPSDPYLAYLSTFFNSTEMENPEVTDPLGDFDHDGILNYLEFAFLMNPSQWQNILPFTYTKVTVPMEGDFPAISFRQRTDSDAPDCLVEISTNLTNWTSNLDGPPVTEVVGTPVDNSDGTVTTTVRALTAGPRTFFRVRASTAAP